MSDTTVKYLPIEEDPKVIGFAFGSANSSEGSYTDSPIYIGQGGQDESYTLETINKGLADRSLIGFTSITKKGYIRKIIKSTGSKSSSDKFKLAE